MQNNQQSFFILLFFTLATFVLIIAPAKATDMVFTGALVAEPCVIPPGQENITLDFGTIVDKYLYQNQRTPSKRFEITLDQCSPEVGQTVSITFDGAESPQLPGRLALDASSTAKGVVIGMETLDGKDFLINKSSAKTLLVSGKNIIPFQAYVQAEPAALNNHTIDYGFFSAIATFTLNYQ